MVTACLNYPEVRQILDSPNLAHFVTLMKDGSPQITPVSSQGSIPDEEVCQNDLRRFEKRECRGRSTSAGEREGVPSHQNTLYFGRSRLRRMRSGHVPYN